MDRDWIGNIEPWGRMVHLTPMERQRTGPYGPVVYDVGIKASNFEKKIRPAKPLDDAIRGRK